MKLKNKKILILGGGDEQVAAIKKCKELGLYVIVSDKNNHAPGKEFCNKFYNVSIKDFKKNLYIARKHKINGILTLCSELAVPTVSKVANKLNLQATSPLTAILSTNKIQMKNRLLIHGIKTPPFTIANNMVDFFKFKKKYTYPIVLKPSTLFGQVGIKLLKNSINLKKKIQLAKKLSLDKKAIIEKFYKGKEINIVALVQNKNIFFLSFSYRESDINKNFGIATEHVFPTKLDNQNLKKLKDMCYKMIEALDINNGIIYPQVIFDGSEFYLIEIATRIPGGYMREMAMLASGIDPIDFLIFQSLGVKDSVNMCIKSKKHKAVYIKFYTKQDFKKIKVIKKITGMEMAKKSVGIYDVKFNKYKKIPLLKSSHDRFGAILAYGKNIIIAKKNLRTAASKIAFLS